MERAPRRGGLPDPAWQQSGLGLIALGALLISVVSVNETPDNARNSPGLWAGLGMAAIGVGVIVGTAVSAWRRRREDRRSPLVMIHDPADPECSLTWNDTTKQLRVRVTNTGGVGVQGLRVNATVKDAHQDYLHIRHDNGQQREMSRRGENATVGQSVYFDVSRCIDGVWNFQYADAHLEAATGGRVPILPAHLDLELVASAWRDSRDVPPVRKKYRLTICSPASKFTLTEIEE